MAFESLTDERIRQLLTMKKRITNPTARQVADANHEKRDYLIESEDGDFGEGIHRLLNIGSAPFAIHPLAPHCSKSHGFRKEITILHAAKQLFPRILWLGLVAQLRRIGRGFGECIR